MSFLANFLLENDVPVNDAPAVVDNEAPLVPKILDCEGHVLVAGCIDWDNVNYGPRGLNEVCRLDLGKNIVKNIYSSCSAHHSFFVVIESGQQALYALGRNDFGQLGTGDKITASLPVKVTSPTGSSSIKKVAVGRYHSIALSESGELFGCGASDCGQLGLGTTGVELKWKKIKTILPVVDVSCGFQFSVFCDTAGHVYSFGHPEYGQLGHGTTGEFFEEGKRKLQHNFINKPKRIEEFVVKDAKNKITDRIKFEDIRIVSVSAGRNHVLCREASSLDSSINTTNNSSSASSRSSKSNTTATTTATANKGRVFSWGFGGYGRLGHNGTADELVPRMIITFDAMCNSGNLDKPMFRDSAIVQICAGHYASAAVTRSGRLFLMGIVNNTTSKECNMYPKEVPALMNSSYLVDSVSLGVSCIYTLCAQEDQVLAWGTSQAGVMGFKDSKTSAQPKELDLRGLQPVGVVCGYLHTCIVVKDKPALTKAQMAAAAAAAAAAGKSNSGSGGTSKGKRPSPFATMAEPTVCKFDATSQLKSYFPPLEALSELDPEVRKAKRQRKAKSPTDDDDDDTLNEDEGVSGGKGTGGAKLEEGEDHSSSDEEEGESSSESSEDDSDDDDDDDDDDHRRGRGSTAAKRGRKK